MRRLPMSTAFKDLVCEFMTRRGVHNGAGQLAPARPIGRDRLTMKDRLPTSDSCAAVVPISGIVLVRYAMGRSRDPEPSAVPLGLAGGSALWGNPGALQAVPDHRRRGHRPFRVRGNRADHPSACT